MRFDREARRAWSDEHPVQSILVVLLAGLAGFAAWAAITGDWSTARSTVVPWLILTAIALALFRVFTPGGRRDRTAPSHHARDS